MLLKAILLFFMVATTSSWETNGNTSSLLRNISSVVKPILNQVNAMYGSTSTIMIPVNAKNSLNYQKIFKRNSKGFKKNVSTVILFGSLADLLVFGKNALNTPTKTFSIQKVLKRTENNTSTSTSETSKESKQSGDLTTGKPGEESNNKNEAKAQSESKNQESNTQITGCETEGSTKKLSKEDLHVGTMVEDHVGDSNLIFVEIPIKKIANVANVSDETFENMAEMVPDRLDFDHQKVFCGKEAAEKLEENSQETTTTYNNETSTA